MNIIKRYAPWLILGFATPLAALLIVVYGYAANVFGAASPPPPAVTPAAPAAPEPSAQQPAQEPVGENPAAPAAAVPTPPALAQPMRGVWVATVLNIDFPKAQNDAAAQKRELLDILNTMQQAGLNTLFFQVRPQGDALYRSQIFPWSMYLSGQAGTDPGYDPLEYLLTEAHSRGIYVHAWINPYRLSMGSKSAPQNTHENLPANSPVKNRPDLTLAAGDGRLYLNPGEPECAELVLAGIKEILQNYAVDGIHLDDYFYPGDSDYDDSAAYQKYGKGVALAEWRRANVNSLIQRAQALIREQKPQVAFGVSPSGIWQNKNSSPQGSDTNGFESYSRIYADTRLWASEGWLDYIAPQLYWAIGKEGSDYALLARWWSAVCAGSDTRLYIGHGVYRLGTGNEAAWQSSAEIGRQLELNRELGIEGSIFYGYQQIKQNTLGLRDLLAKNYL